MNGLECGELKTVRKDSKMSSMIEFMNLEEARGFLGEIVLKYNNDYPKAAISDETLETSVHVFNHIVQGNNKLVDGGHQAAASVYIGHCLATYILLFNQLSTDEITITPLED